MPAAMHSISTLYFDYRPVAGHFPKCPRVGTDVWEAARFGRANFNGETTELTFRFACFECGAVTFVKFDGEPHTWENSTADSTGYGSAPERVLGLWLHPGPRLWVNEEHGPTAFYVTRAKDRPHDAADVLGVVGWRLGKRGGVRWSAGLGCTRHGGVQTSPGQEFGSRRAAVAWIAAQPAHPNGTAGKELL